MNEGTIHLADEDSASDLEAAARRSAPVDMDRLTTIRNTAPPPALPRTSWWRALISSTLAPPLPLDDRTLTRRVGVTCVAVAVVLIFVSLAIGLRGDPSASSPMLSFAIVIARAVVALGILALCHSLLRMGERILTHSSRT
jgi:hypothetical protein